MPRIVKTVEKLLADNDDNKDSFSIPEQSIEDRLKSLTKMGKCVCFIKGSPQVVNNSLKICSILILFEARQFF